MAFPYFPGRWTPRTYCPVNTAERIANSDERGRAVRKFGYLLAMVALRLWNLASPGYLMCLMALLGLFVASLAQGESVAVAPRVLSENTSGQPITQMVPEHVTGASPQPSILEVVYDRATDLLSVHARHAPLAAVLQQISQKAHLSIDWPKTEALAEQVSVDMKGLPLAQALRELVQRFNYAFLYSSATATRDKAPAARLVRVVLLSKKEKAASLESTVTPAEPTTERAPSAVVKGDKEKMVENLLGRLEGLGSFTDTDFPSYRRAIDAVKELAPERVVDPLVNLLLQHSDPPMRVYAASTLGEIADKRAVDPLIWAFLHDEYPLAQQVAMYSLVSIGSESALQPVLKAFKEGDTRVQQAIAVAVARKGDEQARESLARIIAEGHIPDDVIKVWQFASPGKQ